MNRTLTALISSVVILLMNLVTGIIVARLLGPESRGFLASVVSVVMLISGITSWSIADVLGLDIARKTNKRFNLLGPYIWMVAFGSLVGLNTVLFLWKFKIVLLPGAEALLVYGLILIVPFTHISQLALGILQGNQFWGRWNLVRLSPHAAYMILLLTVTPFTADVRHIAFIFALANSLPLILGVYFIRRTRFLKERASRKELFSTLHNALQIHSGRLLQMLRANLDKIVIPMVFGVETLGYYVVAITLTSPLLAAATTISSVYIPRIAEEERSASESKRRRTFWEITGFAVFGLIFSVFYAQLASPLVTLLFGPEFAAAKAMMPVTIAMMAGYCVSKLIETYLIALGHTRFIVVAEILPVLSIIIGAVLFGTAFQHFLIAIATMSWVGSIFYAVYFTMRLLKRLL